MPDNINVKIVTTLDQSSLASMRKQLETSLSNIKNTGPSVSSSISGGNTAKMFTDTGKAATEASKKVKSFTDQVDFTAKRLAAYYIVAGSFFRLSAAIGDAGAAIVDFDKQVNRLTQIFNGNKKAANELTDQIINFSKAYGQSAREVLKIADTLAQAGDKFGGNARGIANAAELIAKTNLAATFGDIEETTEGVIAILNQFNLTASDTGKVLDITNGLAKKFAAEAGDLFKAVKAGGGAFALADNSIENFAASVTTLRSITRLTAAQIGTALNTISVRNLREDVIAFTDEITGGRIRNADGSLKGLTQRLIEVAKATKGLTDEQLGPIIEKISDTRQAKFLIPLIRDIQKGSGVSTFLTALDDAKKQSGSFSRDVAIGLDRIEVQLGSIGAKFEEVFKAFSQDQGIKELVKDFASLAKVSADVVRFLLPVIPVLTKIAVAAVGLKGLSAIRSQLSLSSQNAKNNIVAKYFGVETDDLSSVKNTLKDRAFPSQSTTSNAIVKTTIPSLRRITPFYNRNVDLATQQKNIRAFLDKQNTVLDNATKNTINTTGKSNFEINASNQTRNAQGQFLSNAQKNNTIFFVRNDQQPITTGFNPQKFKTPLFGPVVSEKAKRLYNIPNEPSNLPANANDYFLKFLAVPGGPDQIKGSLDKFSTSVASSAGLKLNSARTPRTFKANEIALSSIQTSRYLNIEQDRIDTFAARKSRQINALTGGQSGIDALKRQDPALRDAFKQRSSIDSGLLLLGGQKEALRAQALNLKKAYQDTIANLRSQGSSGASIKIAQGTFQRELDKLSKQYSALSIEEKALLASRTELKQTTQALAEVQVAEQRITGQGASQPSSSTLTRMKRVGNKYVPDGLISTIAPSATPLNSPARGPSLINKSVNFLRNNPGITGLGIATAGGLIFDKVASNQAGLVQTDLANKIANQDTNQSINTLTNFNKNNRKAQITSGAFSGASTGLSLAAPLALSGVGLPAALAILAGGAVLGSIGGGIGGNNVAKQQQQQEILGALSQSKGVTSSALDLKFLRTLKKNEGFTGKTGSFGVDLNAVTGPTFINDKDSRPGNIIQGFKELYNGVKYTYFGQRAKNFQDTYTSQLQTEEGKAAVDNFKQKAIETASSFKTAGPNFSGELREKLIKEETENIKKASLATGKEIDAKSALAIASLTVSEKLRAAGLSTDEAGSALGSIKESINNFNKNLDNVGKQLSSGGPSIINFISGFQQKTTDLTVGLQGGQLRRGLGQSALSGIFGTTNSIGTNGIAKSINDQFKSDIANATSAGNAGDITKNILGKFLNTKDTAVFSDIAQIQKGFGNINKDVVGRLAGKTFESSDTVEQNISKLLPALFKQQGISVTTGEGKDLLNKAKQELTNQLGTPEGRKAFDQDQNGFIAQFLKKFGGDLDVAGGRVEQAFAALQEEIDKSNASFEKFRSIQQSLLQDRQQKFNFGLSRVTDAGSLGASSSQIRAGLTGLISQTGAGILNGTALRSAGADVIQKQAALANIQGRLENNPTNIGLIQQASEAQRNLIDSQDKYNSIINDTNNAMTLLRARIEETSKQFAELRQTTNTAGGKNFGEFGRDKFKLEQFTSQFGGLAGKLQSAGIRTADQFAALSPEEKKKLAGSLGGLAGSSQILNLLDTAKEYGGASFKGTNVTLGNTVDIIKQIFGEKQLGGVAGLNNIGDSTSQLGQQRNQDFELLGQLQQNQLDVQSNINNSVLNIYRYLVNRGGTLEEKNRLAELDATQQKNNSKNTSSVPTSSSAGQPIPQAQAGQLIQALNGVNQAITKATGQTTKIDFNGNIKIDGLATAGRDKAIGQVVGNILDAFIKQLDRSDPAQALLADKLQAAIKTIVVK